MTLTPGATLQNGTYKIQAVLEQNEWGVTYRASQADSTSTVVVQALKLPEPMQLEPDQLLAIVRQRLSPPPYPQVNVLECFVESNLLFVVLQHSETELDPNVCTWLSPLVNSQFPLSTTALPSEVPPVTPASAIASPETPTALPLAASNPPDSHPAASDSPRNGHNGASSQQTVIQPVETTLQEPASSPVTPPYPGKVQNGLLQPESASTKPRVGNPQTQSSVSRAPAQTTSQTKVTVLTAPSSPVAQKNQLKRWIPIALGITSITAGLAGAGFGWALRTQAPNSADKPSLLSPILNNEQSFPPIEGWVGDDPIDLSTPLAIPEESARFERRPSAAGSHSGRETVSGDVAPVRSRTIPPAVVEEASPAPDPDSSLPPDPLDAGSSDPSLYSPSEPAVAPPPDVAPIPTKIKPVYVPPANPPAEPPPPPSVQAPAPQPPNINGALSTPGVQ